MKSLQSYWSAFKARLRRHTLADNAIVISAALALAPASALLYVTPVRFLRLTAIGRIGHLVGDVATFVKSRILGKTAVKGVLISPPGVAANECMVDYWRRHVTVVRSPFLAKILTHLARFPYLVHDTGYQDIDETAPFIAVEREWGRRPPLLELNEAHRRRGQAWLAALGVPRQAELICFHSREPGYSTQDESLHSFRNSSIENYLPAVSELAGRGFWCLRMGDPSMRRIGAMDRVIDYAHLDSRSDWLDVFLCASCRFFLGSCSGLLTVANVFGKPCAVANQAPLSHVHNFAIDDICIPKLLWSESERRHLTFGEVLGSDAGNFRLAKLYAERGLRPVENTAEDVRDLALEMLERSEGRAVYTDKDEALQQRFTALMRPGHHSYGGINRVGREFLRKYESLL